MGFSNNKFGIAAETTYGTAVTTGVKGYAITSENFTPEFVSLEVPGFRANRQGLNTNEYSQTLVGGTGEITLPLPIDKVDFIFKDLLGTHTGYDSTDKDWEEKTDNVGPTEGRTIYIDRGLNVGGTSSERTQYRGCIPLSWSVSVTADGTAELTVRYWWLGRSTSGLTSVNIGDPPDVRSYRWTDAAVTIGSTSVPGVTGFSLDCDLGMDTGLAYLDGSANREKPARTTIPEYTGNIEAVYGTVTQSALADVFTQTARTIKLSLTATDYAAKSGTNSDIVFTCQTCVFTPTGAVASPESYTSISLPFKMLEPASGDIMTVAGHAKTAG